MFYNAQELAVCQYLDRLGEIGVSARHFMVIVCLDIILLRGYETAWRVGYATNQ